ncbi:MAG: hypothetical protein K2X86_13510 [Cytophagaceae bacterium]|nr:hypothetical protein [Cytophagaceae bacterium]
MDRINGIALVFLTAFAISTFIFVIQLFNDQARVEKPDYKVKVKEISHKNFII